MIKVLHLIYGLNAGGAETLMYNISSNFNFEEFEFSFMIIKKNDDEHFYEKKLKDMGCRIIPIKKQSSSKMHREMLKKMNEGHYDIIHIHNAQCDKLPDVFAAKRSNCKHVVVHSHNSAFQPNIKWYKFRVKLQKVLKGFYSILADGFISCSNKASEWSFTKTIRKSGKIFWLKNGIDVQKFSYDENSRKKLRQQYELGNAFVIGHVGKYDYQKNHSFIIDVFEQIQMKSDHSSYLVLIGSGALKTQIESLAAEKKLVDKIIFVDKTDIVNQYMSMMDVFLFPSLFEGLPVVGVEAQAASLMTIGSDTITTEVAVSEYWRTVSLNKSASEWADIVLEYKKGYSRNNGSEEVRKSGFDIQDVAVSLENYYKQLVDNGD